jgi:uncharacterized protein (DUF302 family)
MMSADPARKTTLGSLTARMAFDRRQGAAIGEPRKLKESSMSRQSSTFKAIFFSTTMVMLLSFAGSALAANKGPIVQVKVRGSVDEVLDKLKKAVASNGMMVMGELHQGKVLEMTGLRVKSETVFVGNPTVGKDVFSADPGAGIVLPVRINVFDDGHGNTIVSYVPPSHLLNSFGNAKVSGIAKMLDGMLQGLVGMLGQ